VLRSSFGSFQLRLVLACLAFLLGAALSQAGQPLYRYEDAQGKLHFTNVPADARYERVYWTRVGLVREPVQPAAKPRLPRHAGYDALIRRAASAQELDPALVKAVIAAESNFDPGATSTAGAQGLMQLMPKTAGALGVRDPYSPQQNVAGGARYLRQMLDRYGDATRALAAYNAGPEAVDRYRGVPPYGETRRYVARVLHYYRGYHDDFGPR